MKRFPFLIIFVSMTASLALAMLFITLRLRPPAQDAQSLTLVMFGSGALTVAAAYSFYRRDGLAQNFTSLRWALLAIVLITVALVFINVWVTAELMFISEHDLVLTIALLIFAGLTAVVFGLFVAHTLTDRIAQLARAADALAEGQLDTRLVVDGQDELATLAQTFNAMADSLEDADNQRRMLEEARRTLIAGVSHDLRTPLTSIQVMLEAMADGVVRDPATIQEYMTRSLAELRHLGQLIDDLFDLAKLDAGQLEMRFDPSSLSDLISDVVSSMKAQAQQKQVTLTGSVTPDVDPVEMAPDKIQRVLYNLLGNALRYTPQDGRITISACREGDQVRVDVLNTGSTIAPEHVPHIFSTFYRGELSRARDEDGYRSTGLGLAIARGFIEAHRGRIWVESVPEQGTTFSFTLPVSQVGTV
jgi:signal transduction histidine kinase